MRVRPKKPNPRFPHTRGQLLVADALIPHIRAGTVTRARRLIIRPDPRIVAFQHSNNAAMPEYWKGLDKDGRVVIAMQCAYGAVGQLLCLRESFAFTRPRPDGSYEALADSPKDDVPEGWTLEYRADGKHSNTKEERGFKWKPAIWMPPWAVRTYLEVKAIRAVRVADVSTPAELVQLGAMPDVVQTMWLNASTIEQREVGNHRGAPLRWKRASPAQLWRAMWALYQSDSSWHTNPWVWDIEFVARPAESFHAR